MKKLAILILFTGAACLAAAQSKKQREVMQYSEQLINAVFGKKDSALLEQLFAKELVYEHSSGKIENRAQAIAGILRNQSTYTEDVMPMPMSVMDRVDSVVTKRVFKAAEKKADGTSGQLNIIIELVWIKESGSWKLARRKATKNTH